MNGFKFKYWMIPIVLLIGTTLVVRSGVFSSGKAQTQAAVNVLNVTVAEAQFTPKMPKLTLNGSLEGLTSAAVSAKISGRVEHVLVQDGQAVQAGQPLVKLESVELSNSARVAQDSVRKAQANYDSALADYNRYLSLFEQNAVSRQQLDSAQTKLRVAEADLSSAQANAGNAEQQYSYGVVTAPVDGVVANKTVTIGQVVSPGAALMTVENIAEVYAVVNIEQKDLGLIKAGQKATVTVDAYPDKSFEGVVDVMNPVAGTSNRMFKTKIKMDNREGMLKPGMFAKLRLITGQEVAVITVPQSAVIQKQGIYYVFTIENGKAVRQQVEIGEVDGFSIEIAAGLQPGQLVAINNVNKLKDGDSIQVIK